MNTEKRREIRQQFFALRNGILADQLRSAGCPCPQIFGLNIPQIAEIARNIRQSDSMTNEQNNSLAEELWTEKNCRESRLLATYLFSPELTDADKAYALLQDVQSPEEADMLAFRLIKRLDFAASLADRIATASTPLATYTSSAIHRHID